MFKKIFFVTGILSILIFPFLPVDLPQQSKNLLGILIFTIIFWFGEIIPLGITSIISVSLCALFGISQTREILKEFSNPVLYLMIGSFLIATAIQKYEIDKKISLKILSSKLSKKGFTILLLGATTIFISMWISNTSTTAILYPITLGLTSYLKGDKKISQRNLLLIAYCASIGGIVTPVGTPPNLICLGMLEKFINYKINFLNWILAIFPVAILLFLVLSFLFKLYSPLSFSNDFKKSYTKHSAEKIIIFCFLLAVVLWILPTITKLINLNLEKFLDEGVVGLFAGALLFLIPYDLKTFKAPLDSNDLSKIDWQTIFLFAGGLTLGKLSLDTGLIKIFSDFILRIFPINNIWTLTLFSIVFSTILTELLSNTACVNLLLPLIIGLAQNTGNNPIIPVIGATLGSSLGFAIPISTPPNAIVFGSKMISLKFMIKNGIILDICGMIIIFLILKFWGIFFI